MEVSKDNIDKDDMKEMLRKKIFEYKQDVKSITITVNLVDEWIKSYIQK